MKLLNPVLLVMLLLGLVSCSHYYYMPNAQNIPLLGQGEAKVDLQLIGANRFSGLDFHSAFSLGDHFGLMGNFLAGGSSNNNTQSSDRWNTHYVEGGAGYFTPIGEDGLVFELFGGMGVGRVNNFFDTDEFSQVDYTKYFIQSAIGWKDGGLELGFGSRLASLQHRVVIDNMGADVDPLDSIRANPNSLEFEPGLIVRFGGDRLKAQFQYGYSFNLTNETLIQERVYYCFGVNVPIRYRRIEVR